MIRAGSPPFVVCSYGYYTKHSVFDCIREQWWCYHGKTKYFNMCINIMCTAKILGKRSMKPNKWSEWFVVALRGGGSEAAGVGLTCVQFRGVTDNLSTNKWWLRGQIIEETKIIRLGPHRFFLWPHTPSMTIITKADTYNTYVQYFIWFRSVNKKHNRNNNTSTLSKVQTIFITFNLCEAVIMTHKTVLTGNLHDYSMIYSM